jgi:hypothetical protein
MLLDPDKHAGKQYRPTGPALTEILCRVLNRKVRCGDLPWWLFLKAARSGNAGASVMGGLRYCIEDHKQGAFSADPGERRRMTTWFLAQSRTAVTTTQFRPAKALGRGWANLESGKIARPVIVSLGKTRRFTPA